METTIEWTSYTTPEGIKVPGYTFNLAWGCKEVSPECDHCYARELAKRYGHGWGDEPRRALSGHYWRQPQKWNELARAEGRPRLVFASSMADVFEKNPDLDVPRAGLFSLIDRTPWLIWLLLTKRPQFMSTMVPAHWHGGWPPNAWALATVGHASSRWRVEALRVYGTAAVRGISCEPLLDPPPTFCALCEHGDAPSRGAHRRALYHPDRGGATCGWSGIEWLILGGESGAKARPFDLDVAWRIATSAARARVAVFWKQNGEPWAKARAKELGRRVDAHGRNPDEWPFSAPRDFPAQLERYAASLRQGVRS